MALRRMVDKVAFNGNLEFPSCRLCNSLWILHSDHEVNMIKDSFFQLLWLTRSFPIESRLLSSDIVIPVMRICDSEIRIGKWVLVFGELCK